MSRPIDAQLRDLAGLWTDPSIENLRQIPATCETIALLAGKGTIDENIDPALLRQVQLLAGRAETRLAECLAIQIRTGAYCRQGALEVAPRVATSGWEG